MYRILLSLICFSFLYLLPVFSVRAQIVSPVTAQEAVTDKAAQTEQLSQQIRAEERKIDLQNTGLNWLPWAQLGKTGQDFIIKRDNYYKSLIGSGRHVDAAIYDLDANGQPDIVLYFWDHCGNQGCLFKVYFDGDTKTPKDYFGWEFVPYKKGVMLDHAYFTL